MTRLIDADALLEFMENLGKGGMPISISKDYIQDLITNAPTVQRDGWVSLTSEQITNIGMQHQSLHQVSKSIDTELRKLNNG